MGTSHLSYDELVDYREKTAFLSSPLMTTTLSPILRKKLESYRDLTLQDTMAAVDEMLLKDCVEKAGLVSADINFLTDVIPAIRAAKDSLAPMVIQGETGTGKEIVVDCLEAVSSKFEKCVRVNCAAIAENLVESVTCPHKCIHIQS